MYDPAAGVVSVAMFVVPSAKSSVAVADAVCVIITVMTTAFLYCDRNSDEATAPAVPVVLVGYTAVALVVVVQ